MAGGPRDRGADVPVMVFDDESAAERLFAAVGERRQADPDRNRRSPVGSRKFEVYGAALG